MFCFLVCTKIMNKSLNSKKDKGNKNSYKQLLANRNAEYTNNKRVMIHLFYLLLAPILCIEIACIKISQYR